MRFNSLIQYLIVASLCWGQHLFAASVALGEPSLADLKAKLGLQLTEMRGVVNKLDQKPQVLGLVEATPFLQEKPQAQLFEEEVYANSFSFPHFYELKEVSLTLREKFPPHLLNTKYAVTVTFKDNSQLILGIPKSLRGTLNCFSPYPSQLDKSGYDRICGFSNILRRWTIKFIHVGSTINDGVFKMYLSFAGRRRY